MKNNISPIFITGTWRSGTTLLSRMINAHQDIAIVHDGIHILKYISDEDINQNKITNFKKKLKEINKFSKIRFKKKIEIKKNDLKSFYNSILTQVINNNKKIKGEKSNIQWSKIPIFLKIFPHGVVIHIIRDPRGVLASWKNFTYAKANKYLDSIFNCKDSMDCAAKFKKKYKHKKYILVKYEDLISDPEKTLKKIFRKIDIKFDKRVLDKKNYKDNMGKVWNVNSSFKSKSQNFFNIDSKDIWKKKLEDHEIFITEKILKKKYASI